MALDHHSPLQVWPDDLGIAFANTIEWRGSPKPTEILGDGEAVLAFFADRGLIDPDEAAEARLRLRLDRGWGERLTRAARGLRDACYQVLSAASDGRLPGAVQIDALYAAAGPLPPRPRLATDGARLGWSCDPRLPLESRLAAAVVASATEILAGTKRARLKLCANPQCGWLFIDDSKNATRRWCSMASCGNRAKAKRHYERAKAKP